jgi:uncharacterized metal-binding protein YceD (DUF177 family)
LTLDKPVEVSEFLRFIVSLRSISKARCVKALEMYDILIYKLSIGEHAFEFEIGDALFDQFENSPVRKGDLKAIVKLTKSSSLINASFTIKGQVELTCDRSLETFDHSVSISKTLIFKLGDGDEELSDEMYQIDRNTQVINLAQYLYEFINLSIPMRKVHPDLRADDIEEDEIIYQTGIKEDNSDQQRHQENEDIDPRWSVLKNLKKN